MKKRVVGLLLAVSLMMTACGSSATDNTEDASTAAKAETDEAKEPAPDQGESPEESRDETLDSGEYLGQGTVGNKWYASFVEGALTQDLEADVKDDFFTAMNKDYFLGLTIEDGYYDGGVMKEAGDIMNERTLSLLLEENPESHDAELVISLYELALNWDSRNELGFDPIVPSVERIKSIDSLDDITEYLLDSEDVFYPGLSEIGLGNSLADPGNYTVYIEGTSLFLDDAAEYTEHSEYGELLAGARENTVRYMLGKLDFSEEDITKIWEECEEFERAIAKNMLTQEDEYASDYFDRVTNVYTLEELRGIQGNYPLVEILQTQGWNSSETYNLNEPEWLTALSELYMEENVDIIRSYLLAHYVNDTCGKLDRETYETVRGYLNEVSGITGIPSDEELGISVVDEYLSDCLDYVYIDEYCTEEERQRVIDMIQDYQAYFRKMLEQEDWISEETKQYAVEKLDNLTVRACYSDVRKDYSGLTFASKEEGGTYMEALQAIERNDIAMEQERINHSLDPREMQMSIREVNAYYGPQDNSVNILSGMLVGDYSMDLPYEWVLANVGATTIGHEMSHAFDTSGAQFDKDGNYANWWQEEDYKAFEERADKLAGYMDQIVLFEGAQPVNGDMVKGEMIADLGGIKAALMIAADQEDFDYDLFFRGLARSYAVIYKKNTVISRLQTDSHPIVNLRINIMAQHCDEFLDTYDVKSGDGMYLAPEDRVWVW